MAVHFNEVKDFDPKAMANIMGPGATDAMVRQVIQTCWMSMPEEKRTVDHVETEIRRLVERALKDLREDANAFGVGKAK